MLLKNNKILLLFLLLLFAGFKNETYKKIKSIVPVNWKCDVTKDLLTLQREDSIYLKDCNQLSKGKVPFSIVIKITRGQRLTIEQLKRRKTMQDSLIIQGKRNYENENARMNLSQYEKLVTRISQIDTLRIPFYSDKNSSYFINDNFPPGYCISDPLVQKEVTFLYKSLYNLE